MRQLLICTATLAKPSTTTTAYGGPAGDFTNSDRG